MLCSSCNRPVKPVAAIDIDGTLAVYHEHFIWFASNYWDKEFDLGYDGSVSLAEWMGLTQEEYRQCKLAYRMGGMKRCMPPYEDKPGELIRHLQANGVEVWITTTRPYLKVDNTDPDTREWLRRHNVPYDGLIYDEDKYKVLADIVGVERVVGVLDDLPDNYDRALELGLHPILIRRKHNGSVLRAMTAGSLVIATAELINRSREWRRDHV